MNVLEAILKRRSIRKYKPGLLTDDQIKTLMTAAMACPSGMNLRPYRFYVVRGEKTLAKVKSVSPYSRYNAPNAIVVIGNTKKSPLMWGNDCGAATQNILLAATELGLGTVWCGMYPFPGASEAMKEVLGCAPEEEVYSLILIGTPDEVRPAPDRYEESRVTVIDE